MRLYGLLGGASTGYVSVCKAWGKLGGSARDSSVGHPSIADEACYWLKHVLHSG